MQPLGLKPLFLRGTIGLGSVERVAAAADVILPNLKGVSWNDIQLQLV